MDFEFVHTRWPELFVSLSPTDRRAVVQALANNWHEGWVPNREDVENITDYVRGAIDHDEYMRRSLEAARRGHIVSVS
jgi:hypothetical protein